MSLTEKSVYTVFKTLLSKKKRHEIVKNLISDSGFTLDTWKEIYGLVRTEDGYKTFIKWLNETFKQTQKTNDEIPSIGPNAKPIHIIFEDVFVLFFENLTKLQEYKILDLYDVMSSKDGYVDIENLYILMCLMIAKESKALVSFLSQFAEPTFDILGHNYRNVSYFLDIDDVLVTNGVNKLKLSPKDGKIITLDEFIVLYYTIFKTVDKQQ